MTPNEHIEEMGMTISMMGAELLATKKELKGALAALEEAQQTELYKSHDQLREQNARLLMNNHKLQGELAEAQQTIARQREALEFYAFEENNSWWVGGLDEVMPSEVMKDSGAKARDVLGIREGSERA